MKLDLGCGQNKREGFTGVDKYEAPGVDIVHDLFVAPWPFEDASVDEAFSSHFFEHIPNLTRPKFMEELYRVLKPQAKVTIFVPHADSHRAIQDFSHEWPPVCEESFLYYNKNWREQNKLTHGLYDIKCDFDFSYGYNLEPLWGAKNEEARAFALKHYRSVAHDLMVTLTKR